MKLDIKYRNWLKGVTVLNIVFAFVIGTGYWQWIGFTHQPLLEKSYLLATQLGWLGLIPIIAAILVVMIRLLSKRLAIGVSLAVFAAISVYFVTDTLVFAQYKFHINGIIIDLFLADGVIKFSTQIWLKFALFILALIAIQALFHYIAIKHNKRLKKFNNLALAIWFVCLLYSQVLHAWKDASYDTSITNMSRFFPLYRPLTAKSFFYDNNLVNQEMARQQAKVVSTSSTQLDYPKQAIEFAPLGKKVNFLFIVIDAWRYDDFNARYTPNMAQYAGQATQFKQHKSGGNSTQAGIFSLFYGLPSPYWISFRDSGVRPALLETAAKQGYDFNILSSAQLNRPPFDRTVFNGIENLRVYTPAETSPERDEIITRDMEQFIQQHDEEKPFFGFLFYDSVHANEIPEGEKLLFQPSWDTPRYLKLSNDIDPEPFHNLYRNSLYYTDRKIGRVLSALKQKGLDENTVVVITSDHGEEFNDNKKNYWGHGGNYTDVQVHVPMIIKAPGLEAAIATQPTNHMDIAPTLMKRYLGVSTQARHYSLGEDMLDKPAESKPVIIGSYNDYAIVTDNEIGVVNETGGISHYDKGMNPIKDAKLTVGTLKQIITDLNHFYK